LRLLILCLLATQAGAAQEPGFKVGDSRVNPTDKQRYRWIPAGKFLMGCSPGDTLCSPDEQPAHEVTISKGYWLGETEVTVAAWKLFAAATGRTMPAEPQSGGRALNPGWETNDLPMTNVNWSEAREFCTWAGGRLPTEAEWEYAARAGVGTARHGDLDDVAWYATNSGDKPIDSAAIKDDTKKYSELLVMNRNGPKRVGTKQPNAWILYDMLGNVWEWVEDWYDAGFYRTSATTDPKGPAATTQKALRGGSWFYFPQLIRASQRGRYLPGDRGSNAGTRCLLQ
jgi:formylglycine-generating enzyme required for sulfatase activity